MYMSLSEAVFEFAHSSIHSLSLPLPHTYGPQLDADVKMYG